MPEAVAQQLYERCGIQYMEAYSMTETISQTHMNPPGNLRRQCLGIPTFDTQSQVIDPETGLLATQDCPSRRGEYFIAGAEPQELCPAHNGVGPARTFADGR